MTGKPETDRSSIGFWLRQGDVHTALRDSAGAAGTIVAEREEILWQPGRPAPLTYANIPNIPPFEEDFQTTMIVPFTEDATVYSFNPHAHVRGKSFDYRVVYPDGREQVMLTVPQYDFNWQLLYVLQEPLRVPAGSTIVVTRHVRQLDPEQVQPGAREGSVVGRPELGRDVRAVHRIRRPGGARRSDRELDRVACDRCGSGRDQP